MAEYKNIHEALCGIYAGVGYVQKKRSPELRYTYAGEAAFIDEIRPAMIEAGVYVAVVSYDNFLQEAYQTKNGANMMRTTLHAKIRFTHKSGTFIDVEALGEGSDSGDKSVNKAMTDAYKYALRQTFMIATGDDPDKDPSEPRVTRPTMVDEAHNLGGKVSSSMGIDTACAVVASDGKLYGDIPTEKLSYMLAAINKSLKENHLDDEKRTSHQMKRDAIITIQQWRAANGGKLRPDTTEATNLFGEAQPLPPAAFPEVDDEQQA